MRNNAVFLTILQCFLSGMSKMEQITLTTEVENFVLLVDIISILELLLCWGLTARVTYYLSQEG